MDVLRLPDAWSARLPGRLGESGSGAVVSLVRLHGVISAHPAPVPRSIVNAASTEKVLERAFAPSTLSAVALLINSPGGSPTQSALITDRIRALADERGVPVLAFCEDVAASGGYWLACAADEIYAHPTSLVGSIGVISSGFGLDGLIERFGVSRRLYTAGGSKSRLDPFLAEKPEDVAWLRALQDQLHEQFVDWVRERRGRKLDAAGPETELFDGEVWTGARAAALGLVDGLGTARDVLSRRFPDADLRPVEARRPVLARLGLGAPAAALPSGAGWAHDALTAVEIRSAWARFGL